MRIPLSDLVPVPAKAYRPWTDQEDRVLAWAFLRGAKVSELSDMLGRSGGAISSRLAKITIETPKDEECSHPGCTGHEETK